MQENAYFATNEASTLLSKSSPHSLNRLSTFYGEDIHAAWDQILKSVSSGTPAFQLGYNQPVFSYFKDHPDRAGLFQEAMKEKSTAVIKPSLNSYNFGPFNSICDVGGGYGHFLLAILKKYPQVNGVLFDVSEVVDTIRVRNPKLSKNSASLMPVIFFSLYQKELTLIF